jgi:hypothetical protein
MSDTKATDEATAGDTATETHHEPHGSAAPHGASDDIPEHETDEAHGGEALGPIDVMAWSAGAGGILLGLLVAACLVIAGSG